MAEQDQWILSFLHRNLTRLYRFLGGKDQCAKTARCFGESLRTLQTKDRSQDYVFLCELSRLWQTLLAQTSQLPQNHPLYTPLLKVIQTIDGYPEGSTHSLGYYLSEHAGEANWVPFPYMELMQSLHKAHIKDPAHSTLAKWVKSINQLY
ncbi:MAG: hypothetical protein RL235_922 [Chlamydiota bacterium]|jgi:hypothetical protein